MIGPLVSLITALVLSRFSSQKQVTVLAKPNKEDLTIMSESMKSGEVTPVIDRRYSLSQVALAIQYLEEGHARGKVVIAME
jgi:NADPH:quinone reductase-like Zn-dependent oxidoreductase